MIFQSGDHEGKSGELVLLRYPDYAQALMRHADSKWAKEFARLIAIFDGKPFTEKCSHCNSVATRASAYQDTSGLMFWCDSCSPYGSGAVRGKLTIFRSFKEALRHVDTTCSAPRTEKRRIIKRLAEGKGLPGRVGDKQAQDFFR